MAETFFWTGALLLLYGFLGYPMLLRLFAQRRAVPAPPADEALPRLSVLLSVFNEEAVIRAKIENFLDLDYPPEKLELLVLSDGCSDRTEDIVREYAGDRVRLLVMERRGGKTLALNRGAEEARGDVLVFTDADAMFDRSALRRLAERFADPGIGLVSGRSLYLNADGSEAPAGAYRRYEESIKEAESAAFSIAGADGAIYALRRDLYEPLRPEFINDFQHPIQAVLAGKRAVSEPAALVREPAAHEGAGELRRQTRIMAQSWRIVLSQAGPLWREGRTGYLWQLLSHKPLRWLTLPLLALVLAANLALLGAGWFYVATLLGQVGFYALAALGARGRDGVARVAFLFLVLHAGALTGLYRHLRGDSFTTWAPRAN